MNNEDKMWTLIVGMAVSIFCFSFGIGKLFQPAFGWIFAGCGYGCLTFVTFWFCNYLNKDN